MRNGRTANRRRSHIPTLRSGGAGVRQAVWPGDHILDRSGASVVDLQIGGRPDHQVDRASLDERQLVPAICIHGHEWVVYSTAMQEGWLMLQCVECWAMGTIDEPSKEEWSAAFHAPSRPYRWREDTRVTLRGHAAPCVIRAVGVSLCDCPSQLSLPPGSGYERVPGGIWYHPGRLSEEEKSELLELAAFVFRTDLCSHLFPGFVRGRLRAIPGGDIRRPST